MFQLKAEVLGLRRLSFVLVLFLEVEGWRGGGVEEWRGRGVES